jgi:hypothetical protein
MAIFFLKFPKSPLLNSPGFFFSRQRAKFRPKKKTTASDTPQNWQKIKIKIKKPKKKRTHGELGT